MQAKLDNAYEIQIFQVDFTVTFDLAGHNALISKVKKIDVGRRFLDDRTDFFMW